MDEDFWARPDGARIGEEWLASGGFVPADGIEAGEPLTDATTKVTNTKIAPYAQICHFFSKPVAGQDLGAPGTGFLFGSAVVVTAAHNLYDIKNKAWFAEVEIGAGRNGEKWPFGRLTVPIVEHSAVVPKAWVKSVNAGKPDRNNDFGLVRLRPQSFAPSPPGSLGIGTMSSGPGGMSVLAPGYTFTVSGNGYMVEGRGKIGDRLEKELRYHDASAGKGGSGGPLIVLDSQGKPGNVVYAMHIAQDSEGRAVALEFTDANYETIKQWAGG